MTDIDFRLGDITKQNVDVIVNAANSSLLGGGGVDGAIHRAGGPSILKECEWQRKYNFPEGLAVGDAVTTTAGDLPAKHVVHTVGPRYPVDVPADSATTVYGTLRKLLRKCYWESLWEAGTIGAESIAFPLISTGIYGWPIRDGALQALHGIRYGLDSPSAASITHVRMMIFDEPTMREITMAVPLTSVWPLP